MYKWHTCRLLDIHGSCIGSYGESSGRSYTILLNIGGSCTQILARSRAVFIVVCLLRVLHSVVQVTSRSTAACLLLGTCRLICGHFVVTHRCPCRLTRTPTRAGQWLGGTAGMGRTVIRLLVRQAPSSSTSLITMVTSSAT